MAGKRENLSFLGENIAASNPSFAEDGVTTKDIDPLTLLSLRIFLPDSVVNKDLRFMKNGDLGYRLASESRYPAAFEDGVKALNWLQKQAIEVGWFGRIISMGLDLYI
ncbi:hypothetical protein LIER_11985 [Lithospermum erythrorhizon]|uniref:Alpha/beta hydrolase fold-3 domain-containing protein n=1 Tax=Lithospermum erythrorhizon TaxID=34254 RepID=A0AAV3PRH2_LITER